MIRRIFSAASSAALCALLLLPATSTATPGISFGGTSDVIDAIGNAHTVTLSAYTLTTNSPIVDAVERSAHAGARISVVLTGRGFGWAIRQNQTTAGELRSAGVRTTLTAYPLHMKAAVVDGAVYVSDTNWTGDGLVVHLPAGARMTVERAILGVASSYGGIFTTSKGSSLELEATILGQSSGPIGLETESFGPSAVSAQIDRTLQGRHHAIVVVNARDLRESSAAQREYNRIRSEGATVRAVRASEKIAIASNGCWTGSSNASEGLDSQIDFGLAISDPQLCQQLLERFQRNLKGDSDKPTWWPF